MLKIFVDFKLMYSYNDKQIYVIKISIIYIFICFLILTVNKISLIVWK